MSNTIKEDTKSYNVLNTKLTYEAPQIISLDTGTTILSGENFITESEGGMFGS